MDTLILQLQKIAKHHLISYGKPDIYESDLISSLEYFLKNFQEKYTWLNYTLIPSWYSE